MFPKSDRFTIALTLLLGVFSAVLFIELMSNGFSANQAEKREAEAAKVFDVPLTEDEASLRQPEHAIDTSDLASRRIVGGVVPHHLLASDFLAEFFQLIADRSKRPRMIVLLAPNHFESGRANLQTADFLWRTPYGEVETDSDALHHLLETTTTEMMPQSFGAEHGIYSILPYIAHFLPTTKIVPIILRYDTSAEEIAEVVDFLSPFIERGDTLVVGSVDFSHYLSKDESDKKDAETLQTMRNFDLSRIANFQSDHLDSPATILALLQLGQKAGAKEIRVLRHDNSADGTRGNQNSTTGHFSFFLTDSMR